VGAQRGGVPREGIDSLGLRLPGHPIRMAEWIVV